MRLDLLEKSELIHGCTTITRGEQGLALRRFSTENAWAGTEGFMQACSAGIRLCFKTDARLLRLSLELGTCNFEFGRGDVDVFAGTSRIFTSQPEGPWTSGQVFELEVSLPEGEPDITVYLPTYRSSVVRKVELEAATFVQPLSDYAGRILFIGDSITQGYGATPGFCYAAQLARHLNSDYLNLGIGGACLPERLPETLDLHPYDHVVLAFGTNDANCGRKADDLKQALTSLLNQVCGEGRQIMVSSPIVWPEGMKRGKQEDWKVVSAAMRDVAISYPGIHYVDGSQVLPWDESYFVDGIHPNATGMTLLAKAFH